MGFRFRKAWNRGPFRFTITERGFSPSVGVGGVFRLTRRSRGGFRTTVRLPGTGLWYEKEHRPNRHRANLPVCDMCGNRHHKRGACW